MSHNYYLQTISLNNYRFFKQLSVDFDPKLTVLVADNGMGKTSVLDAVSIALSAFVGAFRNGKRIGINREDVRLAILNQEVLQMEPQYPCVLHGKGWFNQQQLEWQRRMNTPNSNNTFKEANSLIAVADALQEQVSVEKQITLPVIAYYGTGRLWNQKKVTEKKSFEAEFYSRTSGYLDSLDPSSSYKYFVDWFRYTARAHREIREQNEERFGERAREMTTPYEALLKSVTRAVNRCLKDTGWGRLSFSSVHNAPTMRHEQYGRLEVSQLSDGLRSMVALVADLAYRATRLNPHLKDRAAQETPGIVLIDEVDMHLHPAWQQKVLQQLRSAFPQFQFIVTTHSPQVLSTISRQHIRLLGTNTKGEMVASMPLAESYARSNADVLQAVMHVDPMPKVEETPTLQQYTDLVEQGDLSDPKLKALEQQLVATLGSDHPDLLSLAMVKRRREILG